jgi:hypothetical protein
MRSLDKDELLAQLAEKERRIQAHLEAIKDQGDFVARSLKGRAEEVGGHLRQAGQQARSAAPALLGGGLVLYLAARALTARRAGRRRRHHLDRRQMALLFQVVAWHLTHPTALPMQVGVRSLASAPSPVLAPPEASKPSSTRGVGEVFLLVLAAMAGAAVARLPWQEWLGSTEGGGEGEGQAKS